VNNIGNNSPGKLFAVGRIIDAHGLKGEIKVYPLSNISERYDYLKKVIIEMPDGKFVESDVEYSKPFGEYEIMKLVGIENRDDSEKLKGAYINVVPENLAPLDKGSYYIFEFEGLDVFSQDGEKLGNVARIEEYPSNAVIIVKTETSEIMVPAVHEYIKEVDIGGKRIVVVLPDISLAK